MRRGGRFSVWCYCKHISTGGKKYSFGTPLQISVCRSCDGVSLMAFLSPPHKPSNLSVILGGPKLAVGVTSEVVLGFPNFASSSRKPRCHAKALWYEGKLCPGSVHRAGAARIDGDGGWGGVSATET